MENGTYRAHTMVWMIGALAVLVVALIGLCTSSASAADDGSGFLFAAPASSLAAPSSSLAESTPWQTLGISGFVQNTSGVYTDSAAIRQSPSKNSLAVERNFLQVDINDRFDNRGDSMFLRLWGVYEPDYPIENVPGGSSSDFYNQYGVREFWLKNNLGPLQIFTGKQIVTWGESLAFRVADQINPQDLSWNFGFANLEQSRMPIWMLHPLLNLPTLGPLQSNFIEGIYAPGFDAMYTQVDYPDDRLDSQDAVAGRVDILPPGTNTRFNTRNNIRCDPQFTFPASCVAGGSGGVLQPPFSIPARNGLGLNIQWELPRATFANSVVGVRLHTLVEGWETTALYLKNFDTIPAFSLGTINNVAKTQRVNIIFPEYQGFAVTANHPVILPGQFLQTLPLVFRTEFFYKNHEAFNTVAPLLGFKNFDPPSALVNSDELIYLMALDLASAYVPQLSGTGALGANLEVEGTTLPSWNQFMNYATASPNGSLERVHHNDYNVLFNISDSWWWGSVTPAWTMIWNPDGQTWLFFPNVVLTPPWTNKYFMKLQYIGILGTDAAGAAGGAFKGKSMLLAQFQYNFSVLSPKQQ